MFLINKNIFLRNLAKNFSRFDNGIHTRCVSTSGVVKNSDCLKKVELQQQQQLKKDIQENKLKKVSRTLSTLHQSVPLAAATTAAPKDKSREFMACFPDLVRELKEKAMKYEPAYAAKHYSKALQYNVPGGKKNRGLATVQAYELLVPKHELREENVHLVRYLGWCVEMLQSFFLIIDDIMDESTTRRGQPCWYKHEDIKLTAINDALTIKTGIYQILKEHFSHLDCYTKLLELFHDVTFITTLGQSLDLIISNKEVSNFSMDLYKSIVANKTSYYSFYLPIALAMHMANFTDPEIFRQAKTILLEMGYFFQVQDDFLDCFGDPTVTGKVGTDIEDGKCSWLAVVCMQRASNEQKEIMKEFYGKKDPEMVKRVKKLYEDLSLPNTYSIYEEESYNMIKTHIQQTSRGVPHTIFFKIMEKIYRRDS